jgi:acetyl esterase/lipase
MFKENKQVASKKASARRGGGKVRGVMRSVEAALLAVMAIGLIGIGLKLHEAVPTPDDFYSWAGEIPDAPGKLLRYETYTQAVPDGVKGWRILYSTTRDETGVRAVASAFVMAPETESDEPMPVVAWAHGTTGVVPGAAPTVLPEPFPLDSTVPAVRQIFENGWVIVGTDYIGLGTEGPHPYLIGQGEARSVLDSVRAAKQLPGLRLADKTVVWGHSQGGHAALWTGGIAETYAPDVNVVGVAAAAPATDLPVLLRKVEDTPVGKIMGSFAIRAYSEIYPDVKFDDYVDPFLRPVVVSMSGRALAESSTLLSVVTALAMPGPIFGRNDPMAGALGRRLDENIPVKHIAAKLFVAQGDADPLVLPAVQEAYIAARRAAGQELTYKIYPGLDHLTLVNEASPFNDDLTEWTKRIFAD